MAALFQTISHGIHRYFSTKLQIVETVLLFCHQMVQLRHHLSGVTLVPSKADPAEKASSYLLQVKEEGKILPTSQKEFITSK